MFCVERMHSVLGRLMYPNGLKTLWASEWTLLSKGIVDGHSFPIEFAR